MIFFDYHYSIITLLNIIHKEYDNTDDITEDNVTEFFKKFIEKNPDIELETTDMADFSEDFFDYYYNNNIKCYND